jgi:hypothetical protein
MRFLNPISTPSDTEAAPSGLPRIFAFLIGFVTWISINGSPHFPIWPLFAIPFACTDGGRETLRKFLRPSTGWRLWLTYAAATAVVFYSHQMGKGFDFDFSALGAHLSAWFVV